MVPKERTDDTMQSCSVGKINPLAINKHVDDNKKATRAGKRIFSDLATIKVPQDSGITITNKNWHIVVYHIGHNEMEFYCTKSDLWNQCARNLQVEK